jgi:hypothetical protein
MPHLLARVPSLIDCGATASFTDMSFAQQLHLPPYHLDTPIPLKLVDGKPTHREQLNTTRLSTFKSAPILNASDATSTLPAQLLKPHHPWTSLAPTS